MTLKDFDRKGLRNSDSRLDTGFVNEGYLSSLASPLSPYVTTLNSPESAQTELSPITPPGGAVNNVPVSDLIQVDTTSRTPSPVSGLSVHTTSQAGKIRCDIIEYI